MPASWLTSFPLTLTVDVLNEVNEGYYGEGNNNSRLLIPPPPCGSVTDTPTPTVTATPCSMPFSDVAPSDYFYEAVRYLYCHGVVSGYADGTFRPGNNVTRGQICKIVVLALNVPLYVPPSPTYCDVPRDDPFYVYIETYHHMQPPCQICGPDCTFRPYNLTTRGQLTKIVAMAACWPIYTPGTPTFSDVPTTHPFYTFVETAYHYGVISGYVDHTFRPNNNITRGQVSKVAYIAAKLGRTCPNATPTGTATATVQAPNEH
jgi:5'-nucleotidase / UDP-sugar diphosphatase